MIESPVFRVDAKGISAPTYPEILEYFQEKAKGIFGQDINLDADTQDGQLLAIFASAINDLNMQAIATFNAYNPQSAYGVALDSAIKTNGIVRRGATHSTVDLTVGGTAGTIIVGGEAKDNFDNVWLLPERVVIPSDGEITVTATAKDAGAIDAAPGSVVTIGTPTYGWQSVINRSAASVGQNAETDLELRNKQSLSTMRPARGLWEAMVASVRAVDGVTAVGGFSNDTAAAVSGVPAHSVAIVAEGGNAAEIAQAIYVAKGAGVGTYGTTTQTVNGVAVKFSRPSLYEVGASLKLYTNDKYESTARDDIRERIAVYIASIPVGGEISYGRIMAAAIKDGTGIDERFDVVELKYGKSGATLSAAPLVQMAWNQKPRCLTSNISIEVLEE